LRSNSIFNLWRGRISLYSTVFGNLQISNVTKKDFIPQ
jgi:hypothetical protein